MSEPLQPWVEELALRVYEGLDCPRSLTAAIMVRYHDWEALSQLKAAPIDYSTADSFRRAYQASELLRKYPGLPLGIDTAQVAFEGWKECEASCYVTNERLSPYLDLNHPGRDERIDAFLQRIRQEVIYLIGERPPSLVDGSFGPGATVTDPAVRATIPDKLSSSVSYTHDAWPWLVPWSGTAWAKAVCEDRMQHVPAHEQLRSVKGNVWFAVPKDATTDRSCAKEPSLNAFYQRAYGKAIAARLEGRGFDLRTLPEAHKELAREGSLTGELATIDLKSASDTIASNLVKLLLPPAWFDVLDGLRSKFTMRPDGKWQRLEKFSSMGNGFTFELETTIFLAIARTMACEGYVERWSNSSTVTRLSPAIECVSVFGDDIVVPSRHADDVMSAYLFFGLTPNKRKTFVTGPFRESCGGDFWCGEPVRPYLIKEIPNEPQHIIGIANGLRRVDSHFRDHPRSFGPMRRAYHHCLDALPKSIRDCRGPEELGDLVIHCDETAWRPRWRDSRRYFRVYRPIPNPTVRWDGFGTGAQLAAALYLAGKPSNGPYLNHEGKFVSRQRPISGYKIGWTVLS